MYVPVPGYEASIPSSVLPALVVLAMDIKHERGAHTFKIRLDVDGDRDIESQNAVLPTVVGISEADQHHFAAPIHSAICTVVKMPEPVRDQKIKVLYSTNNSPSKLLAGRLIVIPLKE